MLNRLLQTSQQDAPLKPHPETDSAECKLYQTLNLLKHLWVPGTVVVLAHSPEDTFPSSRPRAYRLASDKEIRKGKGRKNSNGYKSNRK